VVARLELQLGLELGSVGKWSALDFERLRAILTKYIFDWVPVSPKVRRYILGANEERLIGSG
jgi:hypothetical protein